MADAVHFATVEDVMTPSNSAGFSGFPAPLCETSVAPTLFPISIVLSSVIFWYWQVRLWQISNDISVTAGSGIGSDTCSLLAVVVGNTAGFTIPTRELDLIKQGQWKGFPLDVSGSGGGTLHLFDSDGTAVNPAVAKGAFFNPAFWVECALVADDGINHIEMNLDSRTPFVGPLTGTINATFDSNSFNLYYQVVKSGTASFNASQFDFTPAFGETDAFWPYAAADTTPIYDSTTGATLQDPRN